MKSADEVRRDFDRIARASAAGADALGPHEGSLLDLVTPCESALDAGCGSGAVARRLAARCRRVDAVDLSPEMIRVARERSAARPNVEFHVGDVRDWLRDAARYDCITSMAVLHHMDAREVVPLLVRALRPGGLLLLVDILTRRGLLHLPLNAAGWVASHFKHGSSELRRAWREHGRGEIYLTIAEARALFGELLPGAEVRGHLVWRYSVVWRKPVSAPA
ncbi:MAG: class I SAM-dependent methyltransferase [Acidobacteriota bacterium]